MTGMLKGGMTRGFLIIWMVLFIEAIPWPFIFGGLGEIKEHVSISEF